MSVPQKDGRFLNLEEAALLQGPRLLRRNWQRMGLAANCLRFVEAMGVGEDAATEAFLLVEDLRARYWRRKRPRLCSCPCISACVWPGPWALPPT